MFLLYAVGPTRFLAPAWFFGPAGLIGLDVPTGLRAGFHRRHAVRTCFCGMRKSSMVADMPLDNRTVDQFAAEAAWFGPPGPSDKHRRVTKRPKISSRLGVL